MKKFLLLAAIWAALNGCNGSSTTTNSSSNSSKTSVDTKQSKEERNKQIVLAGMEAANKGNVDEVLKSTAADIIDYGDGTHPPIKGLDSLRVVMKKSTDAEKTAFPDYKVSTITAAASGDTVLVWGEASGAWKGAFMGQKPTGKSFKLYGVHYFILNDAGKIIEHRGTPIYAELARQIGFKM